MTQKKILIIEKSPAGALGLRKAKERGCYVIFIGSDKYANRVNENDRQYIDEQYIADTNNYTEVLAFADEISKKHKIDGVFVFMEFYVELGALVAEKLGLNFIKPSAAIGTRNKYIMRAKLKENSLRVPGFTLIDMNTQIEEFAENAEYPNVLKAINLLNQFRPFVIAFSR